MFLRLEQIRGKRGIDGTGKVMISLLLNYFYFCLLPSYSPNFFHENGLNQNCHLSHPSKAFFALSCAGTYRARILCYYSLHYLSNPPIRFPNRLQTRNWLAWRFVWRLLQSHAVPDFIMARNCTVIF